MGQCKIEDKSGRKVIPHIKFTAKLSREYEDWSWRKEVGYDTVLHFTTQPNTTEYDTLITPDNRCVFHFMWLTDFNPPLNCLLEPLEDDEEE